jgi:hypothetical protein
VTCTLSRTLGGSHGLVNKAAEYGFSADLASVEFCRSDARRVVLAVGDALGGALVPGGVVVYGLRSREQRLRAVGMLTLAEMASRRLGMPAKTVKIWYHAGLITGHPMSLRSLTARSSSLMACWTFPAAP